MRTTSSDIAVSVARVEDVDLGCHLTLLLSGSLPGRHAGSPVDVRSLAPPFAACMPTGVGVFVHGRMTMVGSNGLEDTHKVKTGLDKVKDDLL